VSEPARDGSDITYKRPVNKAQFESFLRLIDAGCKPESAAQLAGSDDREKLHRGIMLAASLQNWSGVDVLVSEMMSRAQDAPTRHIYKSKLDNQTGQVPVIAVPSSSSPSISPQATRAIEYARMQQQQQPAAPAAAAPVPAPTPAPATTAPAPAAVPTPASVPAATPAPATTSPATTAPAPVAGMPENMVDIVESVPTTDIEGMRKLMRVMAQNMEAQKTKIDTLDKTRQEFEAFTQRSRDDQKKKIEETNKLMLEQQLMDAAKSAQVREFFDKVAASGLKDLPMPPAQAFETMVECSVGQKRRAQQFEAEVKHHVAQVQCTRSLSYSCSRVHSLSL
jgi:hypothetical protein